MLDAQEGESNVTDRRRRREERAEVKEMEGAQHSGTVSGFGATKGNKERGRRRWLAERINAAVVNVTV